jgi:hypothetical protein
MPYRRRHGTHKDHVVLIVLLLGLVFAVALFYVFVGSL